MPKNKKKIASEIGDYISASGIPPCSWYVGVAENARDALFRAHGVIKDDDLWIYRTAKSSHVAHQGRDRLIRKLKTEGLRDAVDGDPRMVYAYRMAAHTEP